MTHRDKVTPGASAILKRDSRSRVRSSPDQRLEAIAQFERSGLSGPAFCQAAGIKYQTFVGWRKEARRKAASPAGGLQPVVAQPASEAIRLTEVVLQAPPPVRGQGQEGLQVHLPGGAHLVITNAAQIQMAVQLIQALA
jgi:transposase-like protein